MVEHLCKGRWVDGLIIACPHHAHQGRALNLTPFDQRTNVVTEGVAATGQISEKGTVSHREHFDGRMDAKARVRPVTAKLSDLRRQHHES